jgi:hypothetical protein
MTFSTLVALACVVWLLSCGASLLALYWNSRRRSQRPLAAFILSCAALLIGYCGLSRIQLNASKTVNGHLVWSINSRWFFTAALVLGAASLAWSLWNWKKANGSGATALVKRAHSGAGDEPGASPNSGPAKQLGDPGVSDGPPSVN